MRDDVLILRLPAEVKAALKRAAEAESERAHDRVTMSTIVIRLIREYLAAHPELASDAPTKAIAKRKR